jgi:hypothetical protein
MNISHDFAALNDQFKSAAPFSHVVIDGFFPDDLARKLAGEFHDFESPIWADYNNAIEVKKLSNRWDRFQAATYMTLQYLSTPGFVARISALVGEPLYPDYGLNGGGLHTHRRGGKLNAHLDYSIHPKLGLERRLNLIVYLTPNWNPEWGGALGLWEHDPETGKPGKLHHEIDCLFNRAVIFDTSQNSWHGLPEPLTCPPDVYRNSLAIYYLCEPRPTAEDRGKALFAPYGAQQHDQEVLDLIKRRSSVATAATVYEIGAPTAPVSAT